MELETASGDRRRKRNIQIIFMAFLAVLVFFTLFSNTLQSLTLPKVRIEKAVKSSLSHKLEGSGILRPAVEMKLVNPADWRVRKIHVKEGEHVKKGQVLIVYDSQTAERELQDQMSQLEKMKLDLQNSQDLFIQSSTEGDAFKTRSQQRDMETRKLDLGVQERKIAELKDHLNSQKEITAPFDGIITKVNAVEGLASMGEADLVIANINQGYRFEITADSKLLSSLGLTIGEKLEVEIHPFTGQESRTMEGWIEEITTAEPRSGNSTSANSTGSIIAIPQKLVRIKVMDAELKGGEQAWFKHEKRSLQEGVTLSNAAIHQDRDGMFVYKLEEQRGALGNIFVARKVRVDSKETNDQVTMISSGVLYEDDPIIVDSSEPLEDGNRVRLQ